MRKCGLVSLYLSHSIIHNMSFQWGNNQIKTLKAYFCINHGDQFEFEIIINILPGAFRFI